MKHIYSFILALLILLAGEYLCMAFIFWSFAWGDQFYAATGCWTRFCLLVTCGAPTLFLSAFLSEVIEKG